MLDEIFDIDSFLNTQKFHIDDPYWKISFLVIVKWRKKMKSGLENRNLHLNGWQSNIYYRKY